MGDVSKGEGRTVLFVSHNMASINALCNKGIHLENGLISQSGEINPVINLYLKNNIKSNLHNAILTDTQKETPGVLKIKNINLSKLEKDEYAIDTIFLHNTITIKISIENFNSSYSTCVGIEIFNIAQVCVFKLASASFNAIGHYEAICNIPPYLLNDDIYIVDIYFFRNRSDILLALKSALQFEIKEKERNENWHSKWIGVVRPLIPITIQQI